MMDFGIDHTRQIIEGGMDTLSETHSLDDGRMPANSGRRRSSSICSSFSGSFLGWNNDDDSSTTDLFSSGVLHSSLSHLVDSSGFLDWDHRTKDTPPASPLRKSQNGSSKQKVEVTNELASDLSRHISHAMSADGDFLCSSFHNNSSTSPKGWMIFPSSCRSTGWSAGSQTLRPCWAGRSLRRTAGAWRFAA